MRAGLRDGITSNFTGTAGAGTIRFSAGTLSALRSDITFSNGSGVSFGLNAAGVITASVAPAAGGLTNIKISAGILSELRSDITFSNDNGVTFGLAAGGVITASVAAGGGQTTQPVAASASNGSFLFSTVGFSNANGVTFGTSAGAIVTASVQTNYQTPGAYLTTAALSEDSSKYAGTSTGMAGGSVTLDTAGISINLPAYLTTYVAQTVQPVAVSNSAGSFLFSTLNFSNANGVTFGTSVGNIVTASVSTNYQSPGAYLTTAALSGDTSLYAGTGFTSTTTAGTNIVGTLNTSGLSLGVPAYLTVAAGGGGAGTNTSVVTMTGSDLSLAVNTSGVTISYPKWLTTEGAHAGTSTQISTMTGVAMSLSVNTVGVSLSYPNLITNIKVSASGGSSLLSALTFSNSNNITFGLNAGIITASFLDGDTWAGTNTSVVTTAGSDLSFAVNTSGVTIAYPKWLTVAAGGGGAGTNTSVVTTAGSDLSFAVDTSGVTIAYPKWLTAAAGGGGVAISNSQTLFSTGTVAFSAAAGGAMTIASSAGGQSLMFSVPQTSSIAGVGLISVSTNGSTISILGPATSSIIGLGGISISTNGSTITISYSSSASSAPTLGYFENQDRFPINTTVISASGSVLQIVPFILPQPLSMAFIRIPASFSQINTSQTGTTDNTSFTFNRSYTVGAVIYTNAGGNMSQIGSYKSSFASYVFQVSVTAGATGSHRTMWNNVTYPVSGVYSNYTTSSGVTSANFLIGTGNLTLFTGLKYLDIPFATSLSAGNYWLGIGGSTNFASNAGPAVISNASMGPISMYAQSQTNITFMLQGAASASSVQMQVGLGSFSTNALQLSNATVAMSNISMQASNPKLYFQMIWST